MWYKRNMGKKEIRSRIVEFLPAVLAGDLVPNPRNYRRHPKSQQLALQGVLAEIGYADALLARRTDNGLQLIDGHLRASLDPNQHVPVLVLDLDEHEAGKMLLTLDPLAAMAQADGDALCKLLDEERFESPAVNAMLEALANGEKIPMPPLHGLTEDDAVPEDAPATCKPGDLWVMGEHRLLCGDSTVITNVEKLMQGEKADITFTSPPYNLGKNAALSSHQKNAAKYINDLDDKNDSDYFHLLIDSINNSLIASEFCFLNVQSLAGNKVVLIDLLAEMKSVYAETIIWDKQNAQPAMANNVLNSQFEYVHVFSRKANRAIGTKQFRGTLSNVVSIHKKASDFKEHNATFPVGFASFFVNNFSSESACILDLFGGSGSTCIACEKLGRKCRMIEIDPHYCDVIIKRWENFTGKKAELVE